MNPPRRGPAPKADGRVLGTRSGLALPEHALENSLLALAPQVAVVHDADGNPATPDGVRPARRPRKRR